MTGNDGGELLKYSDYNINVNNDSTQRIQEMHIMIGQMLCNAIEYKLNIASLIKEEE